MDRQITFNTAMVGGFDKKSVLKYIDELCEQNQSSIAALNGKITEMEQKNGELSQAAEQLNGQIAGFQQKLAGGAERSRSLQRTIDELSAEIERQRGIIEEKDRALKQHQDKSRQLILRAETLEYKGKKYDEAMHRIGDTFAAASLSADDIIKAAEVKASRMTAATIESIQGLAKQVGAFKGDIGTLRSALQQSLVELENRLDGMDSSINQLDAAVKAIDRPAEEAFAPLEVSAEPAPVEPTEPTEPTEPAEHSPEATAPRQAAAPPLEAVQPAAKPAAFYW